MSETKFKEATVTHTEPVAEQVILNIKKAALDLDTLIDKHIRVKHPDKYIAQPSQDEARNGSHKGWELLKYVPSKEDFIVVKTMDEATVTKGNVYAWRDMKIQQYIWDQERKSRDMSNRRANAESTKTQADGVTNALSGLSGGKIKARALEDEVE